MTIKEIVATVESVKLKARLGVRIFHCSTTIKKAIVRLMLDEDFQDLTIGVDYLDGRYVKFSSYELVRVYGMKKLQALLFIDALQKANIQKDKTRLDRLLTTLVAGKHRQGLRITTEMMERVRNNEAEVWAEYQKLKKITSGHECENMQEYEEKKDCEL